MRYYLPPAILALALSVSALPAAAQDLLDTPPAHLAVVDGTATVDRDGDLQPAAEGMPLVPGDRLRTERGRVELLFPDGTALDVDEFTALELTSNERLRLTEGRVLFVVSGTANPAGARSFHVDTQVAGIDTYGPGEYRLALVTGRFGLEAEVAVARGNAALTGDRGTQSLRAGELSTVARGGLPSYPQHFNSARFDAFEQWAADRRDERRGAVSAQYLPPDLRMYSGALDNDGAWQYESSYGYVWYPTVAADWRPYDDGYWSSVPHYGWTWIGGARWAWPTHHYGRWGVAGARWFWIPERHFAPAWVSWGAAPGYVGWCPLGFDNRPVFALSAAFESSRASINAWVVTPREHFGVRGESARHFATSPRTLPARTPFIAQTPSPQPPSHSASRRVVGTPPAQASGVAAASPEASSGARVPERRGAIRSGSAVPPAPPAPPAPGSNRGAPASASRTYDPSAPARGTDPSRPVRGPIAAAPNATSGGTLPVYAPRPVGPGTYATQGRSAQGGAVAAPGGGINAPRYEPVPRQAPRGDGSTRADGSARSDGSRGDAAPPSAAVGSERGTAVPRSERAQPAPASGGAGSANPAPAPAPQGGSVAAQPRGHRAR